MAATQRAHAAARHAWRPARATDFPGGYLATNLPLCPEQPYPHTTLPTGLAHLLEHMAFKGTPAIGTRDARAEAALLDAVDQAFYELRELERASGAGASAAVSAAGGRGALVVEEVAAQGVALTRARARFEAAQVYVGGGGVRLEAVAGWSGTWVNGEGLFTYRPASLVRGRLLSATHGA